MTIKYFSNTMAGAPVLAGTPGSLVALLDAVLVNGFGLRSVDKIVVAGEVATMTISAGHSFRVGTVATVSGATPALLNGEKQILAVTGTTATFAAPGVANGQASGAVTAKVSPLGWTVQHTATNIRVYKRTAPEASSPVLRVDDTGTTNARVVAYESMSDIETGVAPFPLAAQVPGGLFWSKANSTSQGYAWQVVGDERAFYLVAYPVSGRARGQIHFFGDLVSYKDGDAWGAALAGHRSDGTNAGVPLGCLGCSTRDDPLGASSGFIARSHNAVGGSQPLGRIGAGHIGSGSGVPSGTSSYGWATYPNRADNGLQLCRLMAVTRDCVRGHFPGLWHVPQATYGVFGSEDQIDGTGEMAGRRLVAARVGFTYGNHEDGVAFFDLTGPWR